MTESGWFGARAPLVLLVGALAVVLAFWPRVPQGVFGDQAVQLRAVEQYIAGVSPSLNDLVQPDADDLSRDRRTWFTSHPPGTQLVTYPLLAMGLPLALAVRIVAALAIVVGSIGWLRWFERFPLPFGLRCAAAAALPFVHEASNSLFFFSQDTLNFAVAPWLPVMTLALVTRPRPRLAWFGVGVALGLTFVIKYSLAFLGLGALVFLIVESFRARRNRVRVVLAGLGCALPILVLSVLNARYGVAANTVAGQLGFYPHLATLVGLVGNPALAMADAEGMILRLTHDNELLASYVGVAGGIVLWWLLASAARTASRAAPATRLALVVFGTTLAFMVVVWTCSNAADFGAGGFLILPLGYGVAALVAKPPASLVGRSGLYNPELASDAEDRIVERFQPTTDVWYTYDSITALDLPGRVSNGADNLELPAAYRTSRRLRVTAIIAKRFESDGRGPAIRSMFKGAGPWSHTVVSNSKDDVWTTVVDSRP